MFKPRPKQEEVLRYASGKMGVSAVPGSGKTRTLSYLAAQLVSGPHLHDDQEVLIVTLVNSAVDNFSRQIGAFMQARGLLSNFGYRVRTLHGLANDIVRERPGLVGLAEDFQIVDEREANEILQDSVTSWLRTADGVADFYLAADLDDGQRDHTLRNYWPDLITDMARVFIRQAKDLELTPDQVREFLAASEQPLPLVEIGLTIYEAYQRGLTYRGAVDFQDLIRLALRALESDEDYLKRLRRRWPFILEDEAQDSSKLQEKILRRLVGVSGNWVRVGDTNQAIYETFTTASPVYLRHFLEEPDVQARELPNSGRSTVSIITLANYLIDWTRRAHPVDGIRSVGPLQPPFIQPSPPGDPQPNPPDDPTAVHLYGEALSPADEIDLIVRSLIRWVPDHPNDTVAVLVPRNQRGFELVDRLKVVREPRIDYVELLRSTTSTRETAGALGNVLRYLSNPSSPALLATAFRVWRRDDRDESIDGTRIELITKALRTCKQVEDFVWPRPGSDWLDQVAVAVEDIEARELLEEYRVLVRRWHEAVVLPIDQLMLTLAQDLFRHPVDLAVTHSMAVFLRRFAEQHPQANLADYTAELAMVARNERRFLGLSDEDTGFDPDRHRGKVCIATMHSAKGLEWDRVYLMSVNNYDFPSAQPYDSYISEKWYVRDNLNLEAETLAQLNALIEEQPYIEGDATQKARIDYAAERLRLLYVGITRARRELIVTWNTGRKGDAQPAMPFSALRAYWEAQRHDTSR